MSIPKILIMLVCVTSFVLQAKENIHINPGAENGLTGFGYYAGAGAGKLFISNKEPRTGKNCIALECVKLYVNPKNKKAITSIAITLRGTSGYVPGKFSEIKPGSHMTISFYARANTPVVIKVQPVSWRKVDHSSKGRRWTNAKVMCNGETAKDAIRIGKKWKKVTVTYKVPGNCNSSDLNILLIPENVGDTLFIDDVSINADNSVDNKTTITWDAPGSVPTPAKYESFENGIPKTWHLQGTGKLSLNPWHYKLGKKSLQWDFNAGDVIEINNSIGEPKRRGLINNLCYANFGVWVYVKKAMPGKYLRFVFCEEAKKKAYFKFNLNYKGWQFGTVNYEKRVYLIGKVSNKINKILIEAPKDVNGQVLIDLMIYNGPRYVMFDNTLPRETPWRAPEIDKNKYPVPLKISENDKVGIEKIKNNLLLKIEITDKGKGEKDYQTAMRNIDRLKIIEDEHGIRGIAFPMPRNHANANFNAMFYEYNGINGDKLEAFNRSILTGPANDWKDLKKWSGIFNKSRDAVEKGITKAQYDALSKGHVKVWKYLIDQGFNTSYGDGTYATNTYEWTVVAIYIFRDALAKAGLLDELYQYAQYHRYPLFGKDAWNGCMDHFARAATLYALPFLYSTDMKKQVQALSYVTDRLDSDIYKDLGPQGFKPDGTGYHHGYLLFDYMQTGIRGISKVANAVSHTKFAFSEKSFNILKKVALRMYFYTNGLDLPIFMQGTSVFQKKIVHFYKVLFLPEILKNLALAGKNGCDRELAQAYVNLKSDIIKCKFLKYSPIFEKKYKMTPLAPPKGNISMPYAQLVAQRRADWVAIAWAGYIDMRQRGNHYMYHAKNGPLSILGKDGFYGSGNQEAGWDWNRTNGATVLYMPNIIDIKFIKKGSEVPKGKEYLKHLIWRQDSGSKEYPVIKRGNGGISWRGINGCFRKIFRGDHFYNDFSGYKSYFFIDDRIYALGSNINSDNKEYDVQTNLYQKALKTEKYPTFVDGKEITAFPVKDEILDSKDEHHLIDSVGNGYFIPAGQKAFVARKHQKSRTMIYFKATDHEGDFATAWLEHGVACKDAKYSYVVMPYCNKKEFAKFSSNDYEILQQDNFAHILHDKIDGFYAGIFFKGGDVDNLPHVSNVERDCQIMYKTTNGNSVSKLEIAVGDPDTHRHWTTNAGAGRHGGKSKLTPLKITFKEAWKLEKDVEGVKIINSNNNKTVIEFACIHGKDFNFTLIK